MVCSNVPHKGVLILGCLRFFHFYRYVQLLEPEFLDRKEAVVPHGSVLNFLKHEDPL